MPIPGGGANIKLKENFKNMHKDAKKQILRRLKIISGHLKKVIKMIEEDKYCVDILHQSLACQNALKKADSLILNQHLRKCVAAAMKEGRGKKEKSIDELLKIYQFSNK